MSQPSDGADLLIRQQVGWAGILRICETHGLSVNAAVVMFEKRFGLSPCEAGVEPQPELFEELKSQRNTR